MALDIWLTVAAIVGAVGYVAWLTVERKPPSPWGDS